MAAPSTFLRFAGRLWENMAFDRRFGWETDRIARRPEEGDGTYQLELLNELGHVLVAVSPDVDFTRECTSGAAMRSARVVAYLPLHPDASELVFRRGELIIERDRVAKQPPTVEIDALEIRTGEEAYVRWHAVSEDDRTLLYNVVFLGGTHSGFVLARGLESSSYIVDLKILPGGPDARLGVLASDGVRSGFTVSDPFEVEPRPPQLAIQRPADGETVVADQPFDLVGHALDVGGGALSPDGLVWRIDKQVVARGTTLALATGVSPGPHEVALAYERDEALIAESSVLIHVDEPSAELVQFWELMRELNP